MTAVFRVSLSRIIQNAHQNSLLNVQAALPAVQQSCNISGKTMRGCTRPPINPYDYKNKKYGLFQAAFDKTTYRFNDNSKIIVVDGPIASGKTKFAHELAEELEMCHMREPNMDMVYINPYGYDMRKLDPQLPESVKSFDVNNFHQDPFHLNVATYQIRMYMNRYSQYIDALAHLLSTGQGVVLERSPFSDFVFTEAMTKAGYMSAKARSAYFDIKKNTIDELLKPHLVVYLDVPVDIVKKNIKARNCEFECNSKALTDKYLCDMDTIYKQQYLKEASIASELLVYDWSTGGETEVVVEDIERIDFDRFDKHDCKLKQWRIPKEWDWCEVRMKYASNKDEMMNYMNVPRFDVPELVVNAEDNKKWLDVWFNAPGMKYRLGYNDDMGDTGILTKTKLDHRDTL